VLGRNDIADPLEKMLPYILSDNADIEVLTLFLALSEQPADSLEFDEKRFTDEEVVTKEITWAQILSEEPLTGDHWQEPDYSESDDEDLVYQTKASQSPESLTPETPKDPVWPAKPIEQDVSKDFLQRQYWLQRQKRVIVEDNYPSKFGVSGIFFQKEANLEQYDDEYYLLNEIDALREVLFMLSGWDSVLFSALKHSVEVFHQALNN